MIDGQSLRSAFSRFATGITVVTITDESGEHYGVTVNSFSSVSLDPALVFWALGDATYALDAFLTTDRYIINVLSSQQQHVSDNFAIPGEFDRFESISYTLSEQGLAMLDGSLARFHCQKFKVERAGDHWLFLAGISQIEEFKGQPLIYYGSEYCELANKKRPG